LIGGPAYSVGAVIAILISGYVSDRYMYGRCFIMIILFNVLTMLYDFVMIFVKTDIGKAGGNIDAFFIGFLSDGANFLF
jgi:sugar phosphate permease